MKEVMKKRKAGFSKVVEKIKYKETNVQGFENMPQALIGLLSGENIGKAIVTV